LAILHRKGRGLAGGPRFTSARLVGSLDGITPERTSRCALRTGGERKRAVLSETPEKVEIPSEKKV